MHAQVQNWRGQTVAARQRPRATEDDNAQFLAPMEKRPRQPLTCIAPKGRALPFASSGNAVSVAWLMIMLVRYSGGRVSD